MDNMGHMHISSTEHLSLILSQIKLFQKLESDVTKVPKQAYSRRDETESLVLTESLTPWPAVPHFTAYPFTPQYRTLPHLRLPAVPHLTALPYLFRFVSRKTRCSWRIEYIFISLEPEKFTLYTGMKTFRISFSIKVS